jgi:hypothetical protein
VLSRVDDALYRNGKLVRAREVPMSQMMMFGITNAKIKEKLGNTVGNLNETTRAKITYQVNGEDNIIKQKVDIILHSSIASQQ